MLLSLREIKGIRKWLKFKGIRKCLGETVCPFYDDNASFCHKKGKTCKAIFPKLSASPFWYLNNKLYECPCSVYSWRYVRRRAKRVVAEEELLKAIKTCCNG